MSETFSVEGTDYPRLWGPWEQERQRQLQHHYNKIHKIMNFSIKVGFFFFEVDIASVQF